MTDLNNRVAVVTGGSSGIGRATAKLLARHGARVFTGDFKPRRENSESFAELGECPACEVPAADRLRDTALLAEQA